MAAAVEIPSSFEEHAAFARIRSGLQRAGHDERRSAKAARLALAEAPFAAPTEESWAIVCRRARQLAEIGFRYGQWPRLDPATGLALPPRDR